MRRALLLLASLAALPGPAWGTPQDSSLAGALEELARGLRDAEAGILVRSARDGRTLFAFRAQDPFRLASNTKLFTTAAALALLGPEFRFRTPVGLAGEDLHVVGGGDPNISGRFHGGNPTAVFSAWAARLRDAGVSRLRHLVLHTGIFDAERVNPGWKSYDPAAWWAAPFGPLSLNDNCVDLRITPGPEGRPARISCSPDTAFLRLANRTRTTPRPTRPFGIAREPGSDTVLLTGDVPARGPPLTCSVAVPDPTAYFGTVLRETLLREGIAVTGRLEETDAPLEKVEGFRELAAFESDLPRTLAACNQPSQNFYAEMILRTLGWKTRGRGTLQNGLAAVREFLSREVGLEGVSLADGSGLTRDNLASPEDVVTLLLHMLHHPHARIFLDSLPTGGLPRSTLRNRLKAPDLRDRVRAKTGHLAGISALSGVAESISGETYVFSILVNGREDALPAGIDRLQDRFCELLVRHPDD